VADGFGGTGGGGVSRTVVEGSPTFERDDEGPPVLEPDPERNGGDHGRRLGCSGGVGLVARADTPESREECLRGDEIETLKMLVRLGFPSAWATWVPRTSAWTWIGRAEGASGDFCRV
jgi:hypothetical protein